MRRRASLVVLSIASAAACSLTTSFDGLTGGGPSVADAGNDVARAETSALTEAAADAASGASFCLTNAPDATFCDDFERDIVTGAWDTAKVGTVATLAIDPTEAQSPTRSLRLDVSAGSTKDQSAYLLKGLPPASSVRVTYDILVQQGPTQTRGVFGQFTSSPSGSSTEHYEHRILVYPSSASFEVVYFPPDGGSGVHDEHPLSRALRSGVWEHVVIDAKLTAPGSVQVHLGAEQVLDVPISTAPGRLGVQAGAYYVTSPTEKWTVFVDNVVVEAN